VGLRLKEFIFLTPSRQFCSLIISHFSLSKTNAAEPEWGDPAVPE